MSFQPTSFKRMASKHSTLCRWLAMSLVVFAPCVAAATWPDTKLPDATDAAPVAPRMIYNGVDMRSQIFRSQLDTPSVVAFYRKIWGKAMVVDQFEGWQVLGHREGDYYITVQVRPEGTGSRGDIGTSRLPEHREKIELGRGVPRPDNTVVFNDIAYPDDATPARTLAMVNKLSPQQNASYYRSQLAATGWMAVDVNACVPSASGCLLSYEKGDRKMSVAISAATDHSDIVVNLIGE